jgi:hypothetical protein
VDVGEVNHEHHKRAVFEGDRQASQGKRNAEKRRGLRVLSDAVLEATTAEETGMKTFNITAEMLQAKGACLPAMRDFLTAYPKETYPDGVDYQELLDALANADRECDADWLLSAFGSVKATLELECLSSKKSIYFAGSIIISGAISCKKHIRAGEGIEAGLGIEAGWGIEAGSGIKAGEDYGIYAGIHARLSLKHNYALIKANKRPEHIICGEYAGEKS